MRVGTEKRPDWDKLYNTAQAQEGHFTTTQAENAGYSRPLLAKYLANGKVVRVRRGIYRIVHYPEGEHEQLVVLWLWSEHQGVFSHETALALHNLSDVLPSRVHLTLPVSWKSRRLIVPKELILFYSDLKQEEKTWFGSVPVTTVVRTLHDCAIAATSPELLAQARNQALCRGLVPKEELYLVDQYLTPFDVTLL